MPGKHPSAPRSAIIGSDEPTKVPNTRTWFRTLQGHRYGREISLIIVVKLVALGVLWYVVIKPWPRPSSPPSDVVRQLYIPAAPVKHHD